MPAVDIRARLSRALREALRSRDMVAASALRSALGAIANAEAVPPGPAPAAPAGNRYVAGAAKGLGAAEAERRNLSPAQLDEIVRAEVAERRAAAVEYERRGRPERAERLRREADVLMSAIERTEDS